MSLRDKLAAEQAALHAATRETEAQAQEEAIQPVRTKIAELEAAQTELHTLRGRIGSDLDVFLTRVDGLRSQAAALDRLRTEFKSVLEGRGIKSRGELTGAEDFQEEPEVKDYLSARGQAGETAAAVRSGVGRAKELVPDMAKKIAAARGRRRNFPAAWKENVATVLDERMRELAAEVAELKLQTPEGQQERQQEYRARLDQRIEKSGKPFQNFELNPTRNYERYEGFPDLDQLIVVRAEDLAEAKVIGEEPAQRIVGEAYVARVAADFRSAKDTPERNDVRRLMSYGEELAAAGEAMRQAEGRHRELLDRFLDMHATNPDLATRLAGYGLSDPQRYFEHLQQMAIDQPRLDQIAEVMQWAEIIRKGLASGEKTQELFSPTGRYASRHIPSPAWIRQQAERYLQFYTQLETLLTPENFPLKDIYQKLKVAGDSRRGMLDVNPALMEKLRRSPFGEIRKEELERAAEEDSRQAKLVALIPEKVHTDWVAVKAQRFEADNREIVRLRQQLAETKKRWEQALELIPAARASLEKFLDEQVEIHANEHRGHTSPRNWYVSTKGLSLRRQEASTSLQTAREALQTTQANLRIKRATLEGKRWGRGGLEKEIRDLEEQEKTEAAAMKLRDTEWKTLRDAEDKISSELGQVVGPLELGQDILRREVLSARDLLELVELKAYRSPEIPAHGRNLLATYEGLLHQTAQAKEKYAAARRSISQS